MKFDLEALKDEFIIGKGKKFFTKWHKKTKWYKEPAIDDGYLVEVYTYICNLTSKNVETAIEKMGESEFSINLFLKQNYEYNLTSKNSITPHLVVKKDHIQNIIEIFEGSREFTEEEAEAYEESIIAMAEPTDINFFDL